jgi:PAS domain S-box-containing protein
MGLDILIQPMWECLAASVALIDFNRDPTKRKFCYVNPAFTELTGYSSAEAVGHSAALLNGPKTSWTAIEECESAISQGKPCSVTLIHYCKDGSEYSANAMIAPLVEPKGGPRFLILVETTAPPQDPAPAAHVAAHNGGAVSLALPMPLHEFPAGHQQTHLPPNDDLDALKALWNELRGDRPLPQREEFDLTTMIRWAPHLSVAAVMPDGRIQFRLFGTELARVYGQDLTGRYLDELTPRDLWSVIIRHYEEVAKKLEPVFAPISIANGRWYSEVSRLLLPFASRTDANKVGFIMAADYARK